MHLPGTSWLALWRPDLLAGLAALAVAHRLACRRHAQASGWRPLCFLAGLALLYVAAGSPLDLLARRYLFSARMLRDALIAYVAVPLMLHGTPAWLIRPLLRRPAARLALGLLVRPLPAAFLFNFGLMLYLFPPFFDRLHPGLP